MSENLTITFLRHGRSLADDENKFEGRYDSPLTTIGQAQARKRGELWHAQGLYFDGCIASTLGRARLTAEIVCKTLGVPIEFDPDWMEIDTGALAGLTFEEGNQRYPRPGFRNPFDAIGSGGESEVELEARAGRALQRVVRRGPGRWLVVAHAGILNSALRLAYNAPLPINRSGGYFLFGDLGYVVTRYDPNRHTWLMLEMVRGLGEDD
jgi:2,3-bisphosphoglycerate-dependent phosphoglycerate mutase